VGLAGLWGVFGEHLVGLGDYEIWGTIIRKEFGGVSGEG